jgi:DNA-binding response OmpR family regulator
VDDDPSIGQCLSLFLRGQGYEVSCFTDGRRVLEHLKTNRPDLLITDIQMPAMSGLELIKQVREIKPTLPVITMSGAWDEATSYELSKLAVNVYLPKPFDLGYFAGLVNQELSHPNLHGPP